MEKQAEVEIKAAKVHAEYEMKAQQERVATDKMREVLGKRDKWGQHSRCHCKFHVF